MAPTEAETVDKSTLKSLLLRNLPPSLQDRSAILEVLTKYGDITRVVCRNEEAVVTFKTHNDASLVKNSLRKASPDYDKISIQWCFRQRTSTENLPVAKTSSATRHSNLSSATQSGAQRSPFSSNEFAPLEPPSAKSSVATGGHFPSKPLFGKKSFDAMSAGGNIFSKALQDSTSSVNASGRSSSAANCSAGSLFGSTKNSTVASKPFGSKDERVEASSSLNYPHAENSAQQEQNAPNDVTPNLFASVAPIPRLFGKPIKDSSTSGLASGTALPGASNSAMGSSSFFGSVGSVASVGSVGSVGPLAASGNATLNPPMTLFGKPVPSAGQASESDSAKQFKLRNKTKFTTSKDSAGDCFPRRGAAASGFPAPKWVANPANLKEAAARPSTGSKQESGSSFGNRVWLKNATSSSISSTKTPSSDSRPDSRPDLRSDPRSDSRPDSDVAVPPTNIGSKLTSSTTALPTTCSAAASAAAACAAACAAASASASAAASAAASASAASASAASKTSLMQTRSQTACVSGKFADLFSHAANTLAERYRILELRDKLLREQLNHKPQTTGPIKGTCPDMCPEKERYQRGDRNLVDKYETLAGADGVMDPCRMLKEYQRSSADQEFPLPHEIRSPAALNHTMNYLIRSIISAQPSSVCGEWFTFIWNRTRAIRKDITQQEIEANPLSVQILERCSRFHIHCAHSLCEEDPHSFEPKLNNENFTKCLKSLKYSYHDLKLEGVRCANEAEFVAYEILANLNDAGIAKTITDLEPNLRRHPYVKFAISAMYALHSGNYVRFFNLTDSAPYMMACILHRFFGEVRMRALMVLAKSLNRSNALQLSALTADLYFDSESKCLSFINSLGIEVDDQANLNLKGFQQTESKIDNLLSRKISEKMGPSLAQVVYGPGEIVVDNYSPQDSFTADGMLKRSALNVGLQTEQSAECFAAPAAAFDFRIPAAASPKSTDITDEQLQPQLDALLNSVIAEQMFSLSNRHVVRHDVSLQILDTVTEKALTHEVETLSNAILDAEVEHDRLRKQALFELISNQVYCCHIDMCVSIFTREITIAAKAEAVESACDAIAASNHQRLLDSVVDVLVHQLTRSEYETSFNSYRENLASKLRSIHLARRYLKKWRRWLQMQKEIRNFPAGPLIGEPKNYAHIEQKSPSAIRQLQLNWDALRQKTLFHEHVDNQQIPVERLFERVAAATATATATATAAATAATATATATAAVVVRIVVVSNGDHYSLQKCRHFLAQHPSVRFFSAVPSSLLGSNVVVVLPDGDLDFVQQVEQLAVQISPSPAVGVVWTKFKVEHELSRLKEVLWKPEQYPFHSAIVEILSMLLSEIPSEVHLEEATVRGFVARGIDYCLSKVSYTNDHLPSCVRLLNDIVAHLAAVASSCNLFSLNSLVLDAGWNSRQSLLLLYNEIMRLQLPVPDGEDRLTFIRLVEASKKIRLLTTQVNVKQFRNEFTFLGHIHCQLSYTLNANVMVRYLQSDFINYEVPDFWFVRPARVMAEKEKPEENFEQKSEENSEAHESFFDEESPDTARSVKQLTPLQRPSLAQTRRQVQELLKRSQQARMQLSTELSRSHISTAIDTAELHAVKIKRKSCESLPKQEETPIHFRASKQMKLLMTVDDLKRSVDRLKDRKKLDKLLKDSIQQSNADQSS